MSKSKFYDKIIDLADNVQRYVHVTEHNVATIYEYFCRNVIKNVKKIKSHDLVGIFMGVITNGDEYYQHPTKKNILVTPFGNIDINGDGFKSFFSYFQRNYTPQEKNNLTAIADRLIEDTDRRNNGDFWTPTLFVDYAHKMISEQLGEDWKDKYVVWDNCCGAKNLTRDYKFKELYCSTLFDSELKIGERYNKEVVSFQYDFLNDPLEKLPKGLIEAFEQNKPIVFFLNPPYARNSGIGNNGEVCFTNVRTDMNENKVGACSANLYCQFLWRIMRIKQQYKLTNCIIGIYCPTLFLCGESYKHFRNYFLNEFSFNNAIQFKASHFADVKEGWAISFSLWTAGNTLEKNNFNYSCVDIIDSEIGKVSDKIVYNSDNTKTASVWVREETNGLKTYDCINFTSGIGVKLVPGSRKGMLVENALGYFHCCNNNIAASTINTGLYSSAYAGGIGTSIIKENFDKCVSFFVVRELQNVNWINSKDEYLAPNEQHEKYNEFVNDSIIYSLFHSASNQSSLRKVEYKGKLWDIKNEFFWMSKSEIESLANKFSNDTCYSDVHTSEDRFVYKKLQEITLTPEAQTVLNKACDIVRKTFKYRELFNEEHPEYQINNWDCGWYQIKALAKEYVKEDLEEFKKLYKALADKMRPMVYELGFLK